MGRDLPRVPHPVRKFADTPDRRATTTSHRPPETDALDWEVELAVVIGDAGAPRRRGARPTAAIAGFTVLNDITCRDWQFRTREWLQGKNWDSTTPVGPYLVTPDELPGGVRPALAVTHRASTARSMQKDDTGDLLFDPVALVRVRLDDRSASTPATSSPPAPPAASATPASRRST